MTMIDTIREVQTRSLEGIKSAQEQFISYNERVADTVVGAMPDLQSPFAQYVPKPTEIVDAYFSYVGELYEANRDFATRVAKAWEQPSDEDQGSND